MPFNLLLLTCLIPGTSFTDSGVSVNVKPASGEIVLFFTIDTTSNPNCKMREKLELLDKTVCDLLVFYHKDEEIVLCLVELKSGSKAEHATEQITNTYDAFQRLIQFSEHKKLFTRIKWKAYILANGTAPTQNKVIQDKMKKKFVDFEIGTKSDLGLFLRRQQSKGKQKTK